MIVNKKVARLQADEVVHVPFDALHGMSTVFGYPIPPTLPVSARAQFTTSSEFSCCAFYCIRNFHSTFALATNGADFVKQMGGWDIVGGLRGIHITYLPRTEEKITILMKAFLKTTMAKLFPGGSKYYPFVMADAEVPVTTEYDILLHGMRISQFAKLLAKYELATVAQMPALRNVHYKASHAVRLWQVEPTQCWNTPLTCEVDEPFLSRPEKLAKISDTN